MSERYFLVMNPGSKSGTARDRWPEIFDRLTARGVKYAFALTESSGDGRRLAREAVQAGFERVIAVGGDGTINEVLDGVMNSGTGRSDVPFGVLYTGTSPDFCRWHGIKLDLVSAVDQMLDEPPRSVDVCRIVHRDDRSDRVLRHFGCSANFGLGAAIARGSNTGWRMRLGDLAGTFASTVEAIVRHRPGKFIVRIDGQRFEFDHTWNLFVGKNPFIASGIKLAADVEVDDGKLFFLALHGVSRGGLFARLPQAYTGGFASRFPYLRAETVDILDGDGASEVEYDGDPRGVLPARIRVLPKGLQLLGSDHESSHKGAV